MEKNFKSKVLFILKKRTIYGDNKYSNVNSGLYNSANFVNKMLIKNGIASNLVEVKDNNEIDKHVAFYKPETVIIEALWVTPNKFEILQKLHPNVKWLIRIHSELPFIANEGVAIEWLTNYVKYDNVTITANSKDFIDSMIPILKKEIIYLPNYYPETKTQIKEEKNYNEINIGLFGAIRPMKNPLTQAIAAIIYADRNNKKLKLHINTERVEQKGENSLKNIRALFTETNHELVEHKWHKHADFLKIVAQMDLGLQVSLTETYNIVTADFISQNIPVVTSNEISFVNIFNKVDKNKNSFDIADKMEIAIYFKEIFTFFNKVLLKIDSCKSEKIWVNYFK